MFFNTNYKSVTEEVDYFNQIIQGIGLSSHKISNRAKKVSKKNKKWYDSDCQALKKNLESILKELNRNNISCDLKNKLRINYFTVRKQYKKLLKMKHRQYKNDLYIKIQKIDPKFKGEFWKLLDELKQSKATKSPNNITSEEWISHFSTRFKI